MTDRARKGQRPWLLFLLVVGGVRLISLVSCPSLVQLIMRLAMAVLFWKSGILKWAGLLKLNDTAVTLFTANSCCIFPASRYHYSVPTTWAAVTRHHCM